MTCNACNRTIYDRHMSKTSPDNKIWHSECLKCCKCNKLLDSKYFETSGSLYCRNDYLAYYGPSCFGCEGKITDDQYFFSIKQTTISNGDPMHPHGTQSNTIFFHQKCFACNYCARPLQKGDKYCILDNPIMPSMVPQKLLMICHDICALKYHSANNNINNNNNSNNNNIQQSNSNQMHPGPQSLQQNASAPRAKRGRVKSRAV